MDNSNNTPPPFMTRNTSLLTTAIYVLHHTDLDGKCSAAIINLWAKENAYTANTPIFFIPIDYGKEQEALKQIPYRAAIMVILVDFTCPDDAMRVLDTCYSNHFIWIDHHKTNQDKWQRIKGVRDAMSGCAACAITWELCFGTDLPYWVKLISDYDVWNHTDPNVLPFQFGMRAIENNPTGEIWEHLYFLADRPKTDINDIISSRMWDVIDKGKSIISYNKKLWAEMMTAGAFEMNFHNLRCVACNTGAGASSSQMFESVYDPAKHDAMMAFKYNGTAWSVSLYTTKTDLYDLGILCKHHKGGGHPAAAGFVVPSFERDIINFFNSHAEHPFDLFIKGNNL